MMAEQPNSLRQCDSNVRRLIFIRASSTFSSTMGDDARTTDGRIGDPVLTLVSCRVFPLAGCHFLALSQ